MRSPFMFLLLLLFSQLTLAFETHQVYVVPSTSMSVQQMEQQLAKLEAVLMAQPVFNNRERSELIDVAFARTFVVTMQIQNIASLQKAVATWGARVEPVEVELRSAQYQEPLLGLQWGLGNNGVPQAIELDLVNNYRLLGKARYDVQFPPVDEKGAGKQIVVAVLDTGIDKNHPDLRGRLVRKEAECVLLEKFQQCVKEQGRETCEKNYMDLSRGDVDPDRNGYPMDCEGWSLLGGKNQADILGRPDFGDEQGHGTHVAGIIGANTRNEIGIAGASANVLILPVQVLGKNPNEPIKPLSQNLKLDFDQFEKGKEAYQKTLGDMVARGVIYAVKSGAKVLNFSLGWPQGRDSEFLRQVIVWAQKQGVVIVAAAGNDSTRALLRPCAYPEVICVAAHGPEGTLSYFSNYGSGVDIAAPGVNILSTYPTQKRNVRFRDFSGYEYLHGTSQASPFVAAAMAELLAKGFDRDEAYARLILGTRALQADYVVQKMGPQKQVVTQTQIAERKFILAGALNLSQSLAVQPQALVLPLEKDRVPLNWDRQSSEIVHTLRLKNYWQDFSADQLKIQAFHLKQAESEAGVSIANIEVQGQNTIWRKGEIRHLQLKLSVPTAEDSRLSSEIDLLLQLSIGDMKITDFVAEIELVVPVGTQFAGSDVEHFSLPKLPQGRVSLIPVDERSVGSLNDVDYLVANYKSPKWEYSLLKQNGSEYQLRGVFKFKPPEKNENTREQVVTRIDLHNSGTENYVLGFFDEQEGDEYLATLDFYEFDANFIKIREYQLSSKQVAVPLKVYWMWAQTRKVVAWVGEGYDPERKPSLQDKWTDFTETAKRRFYYLSEDNKLKALDSHLGFEFAEVLEPNPQEVAAGEIAVVMAKNQGSKLKPSYLYSYAFAKVKQGKVVEFYPVDQQHYLDILSTRVDSIRNLDYSQDPSHGKFWFGKGAQNTQAISVWRNGQFATYNLPAQRKLVDAALWVRAVFAGHSRQGAFVFTNSELQYHDLASGRLVSRSLNKYSFYGDNIFTGLHFPLVVMDRSKSSQLLPAIYTTETSGLSGGVKIVVPLFAMNGELEGLVTPARLRFRADTGCKALDSTLFRGKNMGDSLDYFCQNQLVRIKLAF